MAGPHPGTTGGISWSVEDIPYDALARDKVRDDPWLFYVLASASFIEITSDLYTRNLVEFFRHDGEVAGWLERVWVREELQHGAALKRYVQTAWPDLDWESAYRSFLAEYSRLCTADRLAGTRALEMAARCVVETGTATFYRMISEQSREPVLKLLTARISADEVRHYKHFYRYFLRYRALERPSRAAVLRTLWNRTSEIDAEDAFYSFKALHLARTGDRDFHKADYDAYRDGLRRLARRHFPLGMAVKMLLKPLGLNAVVGRALLPAATSATRFFLLRGTENS
ncbi:MAG: ferritin-like domain-containing protein [Reyranellales bacterium]